MRSLSQYIAENNQSHIDEYLIEEGLFSWIRKMIKKFINSIRKNKEDHEGKYEPYENTINFTSSNDFDKNSVTYSLYDKHGFVKYMNEMQNIFGNYIQESNESHPFYDACNFFIKNKFEKIYIVISTFSDNNDPLCVSFLYKQDEHFYIKSFWNKKLKFISVSIKEHVNYDIHKYLSKEMSKLNIDIDSVKDINESIDENLFFKMNVFFQKDETQRQLFNAYYCDGDIEKLKRDGFLLKEFVDFVFDDINVDTDKDYDYQLNKIRTILKSKHYNAL